jgi:hypothetical protein
MPKSARFATVNGSSKSIRKYTRRDRRHVFGMKKPMMDGSRTVEDAISNSEGATTVQFSSGQCDNVGKSIAQLSEERAQCPDR